MRIHSIELRDFRCFAHATIPLDARVTMLIAENHRGKTSVLDAVQLALVGSCRGTDKAGKGADALIRDADGVSQLRVALDVEADGKALRIERTQSGRTGTLSVDGITGREQALGALTARLGVSPALIEACLRSDAFLDLASKDAMALLLDVLDVRVTIDGETLTLPQIEQRYDHWYQERRARKRVLESCRLPDPPAPGDRPDVAAIEGKFAALREQEKALLADGAEDRGRLQEIERQIAQATREADRLTEKLRGLDAAKARDGATVDLADALVEAEEALAQVAVDDAETDAANEAQSTLVTADGRLKMLDETIAGIAHHSPDRGCVLNAEIECRTPAKAFTGQLKTLRAQVEQLKAEYAAAEEAVARGRARVAKQTELQARVDRLRDQQQQHNRIAADLDTLNQSRQRLQLERDNLAERVTGPSPDLREVQARIRKGEQVLAAAREHARQAEAYDSARRSHEAAAQAVQEAEAKVQAYGPTGARREALAATLDTFTASINAALARFGYVIALKTDPAWLVLVNGRPAELLSASERIEIGLCLQLALAQTSGFHVVALDAADTLIARDRQALGAVLDAAHPETQILVAMSQPDTFEPPAIEGWRWLRVVQVDGISTVQPCGEAVAV